MKDAVTIAAVCALLVGVALGAGLIIERFLDVRNILLVFLPVVLLAAVRYGFWAGAFTSLLSVAATSYFTEPRYSFAVADPGSLWALLVFVVVAAYTSNLAAKIEQRAEAERRHSRVIEHLHTFSSRLVALSTVDELAVEALKQLESMLSAAAVLLTPANGTLRVLPRNGSRELGAGELSAAALCWEHASPAGRGTGVFPDAAYLYRPLDTARGIVGVLGLRPADGRAAFEPEESRLLDALCDQIAVSLDRAKLADEMHATTMLAETEKLRSALLTSVSHDLRTPLASILGNVSSLRRYWQLYDSDTRAEMLAFAEEETLRLNRFVENLLQMTRIDAGGLRPNMENVDISDLIGSALKRTEKQMAAHVVRSRLPEDLPMVPLDFVLAEQVLVNLLDNASKYSPPGSTITIAVDEGADTVRVAVMDEGPGIPEGDLELIFDRFFRARVADHRRAGVGLGLSICKGFIEVMGGSIIAKNRTDRRGAAFIASLPKTRPAEKTDE